LEVQVGGVNWYRGIAKQKPLLGNATRAIAITDIEQALQLTRACFLIWLAGAITIHVLRAYAHK
jgi:adenosylcobinamide-phosphate synthase